MAASLESLQQQIQHLQKDVDFVKHLLTEDYELSDEAVEGLRKARETPESEYIDLDDL